jgi:transcriptional regulator with XRE-family HTH domain
MATTALHPDPTDARLPIGDKLRAWRQRRRLSQLDLALEAEISQRHLSFVESGRAAPSREMVLRLAATLDVPLRERNALLLAAGYAPLYPEQPLDAPAMAAARNAVDLILRAHMPHPALAVDRHWRIVAANEAVAPLLAGVEDPALLAPPINGMRLIPTALFDDRFCPGAVGDGGQPLGLLGQAVPGVAASIEDGVVGIPNLVAEPVAAEVLPHILHGVQFRRVGRQRQQGEVVGHDQAAALLVPAGAVAQDDGVRAGGDAAADLGEVQARSLGVDLRQHEGGADAAGRAGGAEEPGPSVAAVARGARTRAPPGPDTGDGALLTHTGFILEPDLDRLALRRGRQGRLRQSGEVFLNASCAAGSLSGCRGRTDRRRKRSRRSSLPTVRSCSRGPKRRSMRSRRSVRRQRAKPPCSAGSGPASTHRSTSASCAGDRQGFGPGRPGRSDRPAMPSAL